MKSKMKWWILERDNPQLGVYYVPKGQLTVRQAKACENSIYGSNTMLSFKTEDDYKAHLVRLRYEGANIHIA